MVLLIDTNILLDVSLKREPFYKDSKDIFDYCVSKNVTGIISAHSITNLWYIMRKQYTKEQRRYFINSLFDYFELESIDKPKLFSAISREDFSDFEDCVQDECAVASGADFIITRNKSDFAGSKVKALTPKEAIELFGA